MQKGVPQIMDITSIKSILHYLSKTIIPSKFETAQQPEQNTIQICLRGVTKQTWLEISWQGDCARIIKIKKPERVGSESTLAKQLSHGLKYMALVRISQDNFERVIKLEFAKKPNDEISKYLIIELMGKHSNIFYLDKNFRIIAAGRQIKSNQSSFRTISTGSLYSSPPQTLKKSPCEKENFETWAENISTVPKLLKDCLLENYQGVSPMLTTQIEYIANLKTKNLMNTNIDLITEKNLKEIFRIWKLWIFRFKNNIFYFSTFSHNFYCVWFSKNDISTTPQFDLADGLENYYDYFLKLKKIEYLFLKLDGIIFKQQNINKKNCNEQIKLLNNAENHESFKTRADNIFLRTNINKASIIEAEKLYKKSKKLKRARKSIIERLAIYKNKLKRLDEFSNMLENINSSSIESMQTKIYLMEELRNELCSEFSIKIKTIRESKKSKDTKTSPIEINSPGGITILIGRNMRQNDLISFKLSKKGDLWFHAQESPGSHVVLKSSVKIADEQDIQISADIAAFFCKAKGNVKVPINLVKSKDLYKLNSGGLGCVSFKNMEIIWGNPKRGEDYIKSNPQC